MNDSDFDSIMALQGERPGISVFLSSTPTGERKRFYQCCTDPKLGFKEFHYPSMCNPDWSPEMEDEFRAQLSQAGYTHEILAEFGEQETGVFTKEKVDAALTYYDYYYSPLSLSHQRLIASEERTPDNLIVPEDYIGIYKPNIWRTMGIDWDKYGASSSLLILDYDIIRHKFIVIKRVEVPKVEYSFDAAVKLVIRLNEIYMPSFIYADRGSGEYQLETLHIYGEEHPESGLKNKLKGFQFKQNIEITDPVKGTITKEPMKPFMVNQLAIAFDRDNMILSPYDETLHKQLIDYSVEKIGANGQPVFTSENEHFVDALGLAYLAFVMEFPDITKTVKQIENPNIMKVLGTNPMSSRVNSALRKIKSGFGISNPWGGLTNGSYTYETAHDPNEARCDMPKWFQCGEVSFRSSTSISDRRNGGWGARIVTMSGNLRSTW